MSEHNYLDDLDNLLDNPRQSAVKDSAEFEANEVDKNTATDRESMMPISPLATDEAHLASQTWANVIESASRALQDSTLLAQEATRKNLDLAKEQQES
ncbi:MAG TPA: hypothetical protein PLF09_01640, partial [Thiotrichales bacterium]|nr:hypothetical protein [Thiotrichales bacterium]